MANFEAFHQVTSPSINFLFLKSVIYIAHWYILSTRTQHRYNVGQAVMLCSNKKVFSFCEKYIHLYHDAENIETYVSSTQSLGNWLFQMNFGSIVQTLLIQVKASAMQLHVHTLYRQYIKDILPDSVLVELYCLGIPVNFQQQQQARAYSKITQVYF